MTNGLMLFDCLRGTQQAFVVAETAVEASDTFAGRHGHRPHSIKLIGQSTYAQGLPELLLHRALVRWTELLPGTTKTWIYPSLLPRTLGIDLGVDDVSLARHVLTEERLEEIKADAETAGAAWMKESIDRLLWREEANARGLRRELPDQLARIRKNVLALAIPTDGVRGRPPAANAVPDLSHEEIQRHREQAHKIGCREGRRQMRDYVIALVEHRRIRKCEELHGDPPRDRQQESTLADKCDGAANEHSWRERGQGVLNTCDALVQQLQQLEPQDGGS